MADFCKQCSIELFGEDFEELAGLSTLTEETDKLGLVVRVLCEGCGATEVNSKGECQFHHNMTQEECFQAGLKSAKTKISEEL